MKPNATLIRYCRSCGRFFVQRRPRARRLDRSVVRPGGSGARPSEVATGWTTSSSCPRCGNDETLLVDTAPTLFAGLDLAARLEALSHGAPLAGVTRAAS